MNGFSLWPCASPVFVPINAYKCLPFPGFPGHRISSTFLLELYTRINYRTIAPSPTNPPSRNVSLFTHIGWQPLSPNALAKLRNSFSLMTRTSKMHSSGWRETSSPAAATPMWGSSFTRLWRCGPARGRLPTTASGRTCSSVGAEPDEHWPGSWCCSLSVVSGRLGQYT